MKRIFLADDDDSDRWDLMHLINSINPAIEVVGFKNGLELMQNLTNLGEDQLPSVIFLDLRMPIWDGVKSLNALMTNPKFFAIPVYMWSVMDTKNEMDLCLNLGAQDFITKPTMEEEWIAVKIILSRIINRLFVV